MGSRLWALKAYRLQREFLEWLRLQTVNRRLPEAETFGGSRAAVPALPGCEKMVHPDALIQDGRDKPAGGDAERSKTREKDRVVPQSPCEGGIQSTGIPHPDRLGRVRHPV